MMNNNLSKEYKNKILKFCEPEEVFRKIPLVKLKEYFEIIEMPAVKSVLEDENLMFTVKEFFKNDLNISKTSKSAFMHRNTLIYRLEKIKNIIGLNLKSFEEARIFKNIMLINEVLKEKLIEKEQDKQNEEY